MEKQLKFFVYLALMKNLWGKKKNKKNPKHFKNILILNMYFNHNGERSEIKLWVFCGYFRGFLFVVLLLLWIF